MAKTNILIDDDEQDIRESLRDILEDEGHKIFLAENAENAKIKLSHFKFDLIVLDVMMPGQNGYDLTKDIKKNIANTALFEEVSSKTNLIHTDQDDDFVDFNIQITIPHKFSQFGPSIAVGDLNGDKLEDVLIGGSKGKSEVLFYQKPDGTFYKENTNLKRQKNITVNTVKSPMQLGQESMQPQ